MGTRFCVTVYPRCVNDPKKHMGSLLDLILLRRALPKDSGLDWS